MVTGPYSLQALADRFLQRLTTDDCADGEPIAQHRLEQTLIDVSIPHGGLDRVLSIITMILQQTGTLQSSL